MYLVGMSRQGDAAAIEAALVGLWAWAGRRMQESVRDQGVDLDAAGYRLLATIDRVGPARLSQLAPLLGVEPSTLSRQAAELERRRLVVRDADPSDARASLFRPTDAGAELLTAVRRVRRHILTEVLTDWDGDDSHDFAVLLARFVHDVQSRLGPPTDDLDDPSLPAPRPQQVTTP